MLAGNLHAFMIAPNLERTDFHIIATLPDTVDDRNQFIIGIGFGIGITMKDMRHFLIFCAYSFASTLILGNY